MGIERFFITIGGINCAIISQDISFLNLLRTRYQWFESSGPATYEILVRPVPIEEFTLEDMGQLSSPLVKKVNSGANYIMRGADDPFVAVVNTSSKKALVKTWNNQYCFDSFFRMLFTLILIDEMGLLLQASAVSEGGRGSVFFGPSGSGKTTIARLSGDRIVLSDELVLIRPHNGRYRVYGTPFGGEFTLGQSNARAEIGGLFLLHKDIKNGLVPLDKVQAVTNLYHCVPFFSDDSRLLNRLIDTCRTLADTVPVYELHFLPDPSFWQVLNEQSLERSASIHSDTCPTNTTQCGGTR